MRKRKKNQVITYTGDIHSSEYDERIKKRVE